ncbi:C25 family cysteine peptidase [candidate division KSB1 bacterium]
MKRNRFSQVVLLFAITIFFVICKNSTESISNPTLNKPDYDLTGNKMLIISTPEYETALSGFINWKKEKGLDVELDVSSAGKGINAVKTKLKEKYENDGLTYIILVGDIDDVPSPMYQGYPSDPSYALLDGDDFIGDAFISRIPVNNTTELHNILNKIIIYEKALFENTEWLKTAVIPQTIEFNGQELADAIESAMKDNPEYFNRIIKVMENEPDPEAKLLESIEKYGAHMIVYNSHGSETEFGNIRFSVNDIKNLKFPEKCFPIIHGCGCLTGNFAFNGGNCLAETALKTGTLSRPAGPVAMLAFTCPANPGPAMTAQRELFTNMYYNKDKYKTFGALCYYSNLYAMNKYGEIEAEKHYKKCHLFGDCSMIVWKTAPGQN